MARCLKPSRSKAKNAVPWYSLGDFQDLELLRSLFYSNGIYR
jgi:hypothetical protein